MIRDLRKSNLSISDMSARQNFVYTNAYVREKISVTPYLFATTWQYIHNGLPVTSLALQTTPCSLLNWIGLSPRN